MFSCLIVMLSNLNFAPEGNILLTVNETEVNQVMPTTSEIYFKPEETGTIKFFSLQTILMTENKHVCFRRDDVFLSRKHQASGFYALQTLQNRKKQLVPDGLAICANSQSFSNDLLIWEALFSGWRATCWIKAARIRKKNATL